MKSNTLSRNHNSEGFAHREKNLLFILSTYHLILIKTQLLQWAVAKQKVPYDNLLQEQSLLIQHPPTSTHWLKVTIAKQHLDKIVFKRLTKTTCQRDCTKTLELLFSPVRSIRDSEKEQDCLYLQIWSWLVLTICTTNRQDNCIEIFSFIQANTENWKIMWLWMTFTSPASTISVDCQLMSMHYSNCHKKFKLPTSSNLDVKPLSSKTLIQFFQSMDILKLHTAVTKAIAWRLPSLEWPKKIE